MASESRWNRQNVDYYFDPDDPWLTDLPWSVGSCWHVFLLHVRTHGNKRGLCPVVAASMIAAPYRIPPADMVACLEAAERGGALTVEKGHCVVTRWEKSQTPDAKRVQNRRKRNCPGQTAVVTDNTGQVAETKSESVSNSSEIVTDNSDLLRTTATCSDSLSRDSNSNSNPHTADAVLPQGADAAAADSPWWADHPDPLVAWTGEQISAIPKFQNCRRPPTAARVDRVVDRLRQEAPDEEVIRGFVMEFAEFHTDHPNEFGKDDPVGILDNRITDFLPRWRKVKTQLTEVSGGGKKSSPNRPLLEVLGPVAGVDFEERVVGLRTSKVSKREVPVTERFKPGSDEPFDEAEWWQGKVVTA